MRTCIIFSLICAICLVSACQKKQKTAAGKAITPSSQMASTGFSPSPDSVVTKEQALTWLACNHSLDSISYSFQDSFKTEDPSKRLKYQNSFIAAQNTVCVQQGYKGGYEEYLWISHALSNPKNKQLRDALKITTF